MSPEPRSSTDEIDRLLANISNKAHSEVPIKTLQKLVSLTIPDQTKSEHVWHAEAIIGSIDKYSTLTKQKTAYVYVDRNRGIDADRRETQGIIEGREVHKVPVDKIVLFILRTTAEKSKEAVWWPQLRFPSGRYAFAFAV